MSTDIFAPGLRYYIQRIDSGMPYTWIRLGDGEWSSILQDRNRTSSGSQRLDFRQLKKLMSKVIIAAPKDPNYILSMRPGSQRSGINSWLANATPPHIKWHDCRVLYKASKHGELYPWVKAIRDCGLPVVMVGPRRHATLDGRLCDIAKHVLIPNRDCFVQRERIVKEVLDFGKPAIILFSAGPAAKVMCWQLWPHIGKTSYVLDVGSLLDIYCLPPKRSRQYHKYLLSHPGIIKKNLGLA